MRTQKGPRTNIEAPWSEPTNMYVARETAQIALLGEKHRWGYFFFEFALIVILAAVTPRVGNGTWLEYPWVIPAMILASTIRPALRQMAFGRPASRVLTAVITVVALWLCLISVFVVLSLTIGPDSNRASLGTTGQFVFVGFLVVGIVAAYRYMRREWPRQDAAVEQQARVERAARAANLESGRMVSVNRLG